jgi:uncharacterized protein YecE (DUF72 family)
MPPLYIGTASWQFSGWNGVFYPKELAKDEQLAFYAQRFNTVEVNTTFYGLPRPATLVKWVQSVPVGFKFCLKAPRVITHDKRLIDCEGETRSFLEVLRALGRDAALAFLQFPPNFTRQKEGRALALYLDWLAPQCADLQLGVEVRSPDLMTPAFARFVAERKMAFVLVDRVNTDDLYDSWVELTEEGKTPPFSIIRWIGDDQNGPQGDDTITVERDVQLAQWAQRILNLHRLGLIVYGYMHNPYEGHSPASVRRLLDRLTPALPLPIWPPLPPVAPASAEVIQRSLF